MNLQELNQQVTKLSPKKVQEILILIAKHARLAKRASTTGFNAA